MAAKTSYAKPSYLGLLNAVALAEGFAADYFDKWEAMARDKKTKAVLHTVAMREREHSLAFSKRLDELGYGVLPREPEAYLERYAEIATSDKTDLEKLDLLGYDKDRDGPDAFENFFKDHTIDVTTGALLGRYICEERDTVRLLRSCRQRLAAKQR